MKTIAVTAIALAAAAPALAAERSVAQQQEAVRTTHRAPDLDLRTGFAGSGFLISGGSDSSDVSLSLSRDWDSSGARNINFNTFSLKLTAPMDKDSKEGAFITEGGLPNTLSLDLAFTRIFAREYALPATSARRIELYRQAQATCLVQQSLALQDGTKAKKACESKKSLDALSEYLSDEENSELDDEFDHHPIWLAGVSGSIGRKSFDFRRRSDFTELSDRKTPFAVAAFFGVSPNANALYLGGGYEYKRTYKSVKSETLCPAVAPGTTITCFTGPFAEPVRNVDSNAFAVVRWQGVISFGEDRKVPFGIELKGTYDFRDDVLGLSVPVYFVGDDKGLRGGVKFQWQNDTDKFGVRIFVGSSFNLFGR